MKKLQLCEVSTYTCGNSGVSVKFYLIVLVEITTCVKKNYGWRSIRPIFDVFLRLSPVN